jgi:hypothetical protein
MKLHSLLSAIAAASLAALLITLLGSSAAGIGFAAFTAGLLALTVTREYATRNHFVVTAGSPRAASFSHRALRSYGLRAPARRASTRSLALAR